MLKKDLTMDDFHICQYVDCEEIEEVMGKRRYKKFMEWMGGQTCPMVGNKLAIYPWDIENYLKNLNYEIKKTTN